MRAYYLMLMGGDWLGGRKETSLERFWRYWGHAEKVCLTTVGFKNIIFVGVTRNILLGDAFESCVD